MMARKPCQVRTLDVAGLQPRHFAIVVMRCVQCAPLPIVPLADESAPVLNIEFNFFVADFKRGFLVAIVRCGKQVEAIGMARWQVDCLPARHNRVGRAGLGRSQLKPHIVEHDLRGQHLSGKRVALAVEAVRRAIAVIAGCREVIGQSHWGGSCARNLGCRRRQPDRERARLIGAERCDQRAAGYGRRSNRLFLPVHFARIGDGGSEGDANSGLGLAVEFHQAHDDLIPMFRLLERQNPYARIVDLHQGEAPAQRAFVLRGFKDHERSIQSLRLPVGLRCTPAGCVARNAVREFVVPNILRSLVRIASGRAWGADQRQANGVVVGLVRSVLAIGQDGRSELPAHVGQVDPLVRRHFEFLRLRRGPLDRANVPVIGGHKVRSRKRKGRLEIRFPGVPVNHIAELDTPSRIARG